MPTSYPTGWPLRFRDNAPPSSEGVSDNRDFRTRRTHIGRPLTPSLGDLARGRCGRSALSGFVSFSWSARRPATDVI
jgi:hypothetical protein